MLPACMDSRNNFPGILKNAPALDSLIVRRRLDPPQLQALGADLDRILRLLQHGAIVRGVAREDGRSQRPGSAVARYVLSRNGSRNSRRPGLYAAADGCRGASR